MWEQAAGSSGRVVLCSAAVGSIWYSTFWKATLYLQHSTAQGCSGTRGDQWHLKVQWYHDQDQYKNQKNEEHKHILFPAKVLQSGMFQEQYIYCK